MSLRTHAVVVQPDQWSGAPAELARVLAPVIGLDIAPLADALQRGPMTVEADLSASEASALVNRLSSIGVPAEIQPPIPVVSARTAPSQLTVDRARITDEVPRSRSNTMMGFKPMVTEETEDSGWGAVFPDLAAKAPAPAEPAEPTEPAEAATPPDEAPRPPKLPTPPKSAPPSLDDLEEPVPPPMHTPRQQVITPSLGPVAATMEPTPPLERDVVAPRTQTPAPPQPASQPAQPAQPTPVRANKTPTKPTGFDASKLSALLPAEETERPPHKPTGYDPRPEHHPPFATMFAVMAPGAGHVFNGDEDEAVDVALRFWAVVPWVRSVRQAADRAEKIRTYWAPRPPDGNGVRAFKFVFAFWLCVGLVTAGLAWGIPTIAGVVMHEPAEVGVGPEQITSAFESAETGVLSARVKALSALERASADLIPDAKYTLTEEERANRLFAIGYFECKRRSYMMCEGMMRRVLELKPAYGKAIRLQAWASVSKNGRREEFPELGDVPTLTEIELNDMREEMILEGEHVPPPPKPNFAAEQVDAGVAIDDAPSPDAGSTQ